MTRIVFSLDISRSISLLIYLILLHLIMLITLISLLDMFWWSVAMIVGLSLSFIYYAQRYQWLGNNKSITQIERDADDKWYLIYGNSDKHPQLTLMNNFITPQLAILSFKGRSFWQRYAVTLSVDAVDQELFRQLRVYCCDPKTFQQ